MSPWAEEGEAGRRKFQQYQRYGGADRPPHCRPTVSLRALRCAGAPVHTHRILPPGLVGRSLTACSHEYCTSAHARTRRILLRGQTRRPRIHLTCHPCEAREQDEASVHGHTGTL
jgi:hypothetical protein